MVIFFVRFSNYSGQTLEKKNNPRSVTFSVNEKCFFFFFEFSHFSGMSCSKIFNRKFHIVFLLPTTYKVLHWPLLS